MTDQRPWLQRSGYVDDNVKDAVVMHKKVSNGARVTVRLDENRWCVASFANRANETSISFVISGISNDDLRNELNRCEAELSWLYETFNGK
jgi:hypothetical protein